MIIILGVSIRDEELALRNVKWWNELGGCHGHEVLFIYDERIKLTEQIRQELAACFGTVHILKSNAAVDGWPQGANYFFRMATGWLSLRTSYKYFLWMEPDAIPTEPGWIDKLEADHIRSGKMFTGARVEFPQVPLHMSGIGIYENPIYNHAGEAFRAFDVAWDIAAKDQIVPLANFTKLIQHEWNRPKFTSTDEIQPGTIIFHGNKEGNLIDLLRQKPGGKLATGEPVEPPEKEPMPTRFGSPARLSASIFIRTYPGDFKWLKYCLKSITKFASGFQNIWITSPEATPEQMAELGPMPPSVIWRVVEDDHQDGYMAQQITKLYADMLTADPISDFLLIIDSDTLLTKPVTPETFLKEGKAIWYYTPYENLVAEKKWQPVTEKFLGRTLRYEFMQRPPTMVPRWLFPALREFCHSRHAMVISQYVKMQPGRDFSEFNALGAYAYEFHREKISWINTLDEVRPKLVSRWFHSWSGMTSHVVKEINEILSEPPEETGTVAPAELSTGALVRALKAIADKNQDKRNEVLKLLRKHGLRTATKKVKTMAVKQAAKETVAV